MAGDHQDDSVRDQAIRIDVNAAQTVEWETEGLNLEDQANSSNVQQWQQQLWANPPPLFTDVGEFRRAQTDDCEKDHDDNEDDSDYSHMEDED
ncbi:hypothetical protein V6N12_009798 [Hibiscus sabdariffa]|uniref:Uncharacterized protein n=1 Tax=Hibiscus sabdariffa TaxID=183260 RepID=A0ABR2EBS1_9ROSI